MSFIVGVLTFLLIVNCVALLLLILVQLPKKDAGAGLAFGGGAADALFGAGSGNALTKITKWAAGIFIGLSIILASLQVRLHSGNASEFQQRVEQQQQAQTPVQAPAQTPPALPPAASPSAPAMPLFSATNATAPAPANGK